MYGLIIGKFHPPHKGHRFLIDTATSEVDQLTILLCDSHDFSIPVESRMKWLRQLHPHADIRVLNQDAFDNDDANNWIKATLDIIGEPPDCVFSSEDYGIQYADQLGCQHRMVDKERTTVPVSGREFWKNPKAHLDYLEPLVAEYFLSEG